MKPSVDKAIVLSRTNYGERDRVITLLAQESGKMSVFAKGVRAQKSRLAGGIELLSISDITFVQGKTGLKTLTGSRLIKHFGAIAGDIDRMNQVFAALKIINKLTEEGGGQEYFDVLNIFFESLEDRAYDPRIVELWMDLRLLSLTGTMPRLNTGTPEDKGSHFNFDHETQSFVFHPDGQYSQNDIKLLKILAHNSKPIKLQNKSGGEDALMRLLQLLLKTNLTEV